MDDLSYLLSMYPCVRRLPDGTFVAVQRQITNDRVIHCTRDSVIEGWHHASPTQALIAFAKWEGTGDPPGRWLRHDRPLGAATAYRRRLGDDTIVETD